MTQIWKTTGFVTDDPWVLETAETQAAETQAADHPAGLRAAGSNERAIHGLTAFIEKAEAGETGLGVLINPADDVARLQPYLDHIALVAVAFPAFNDGRAFSHASLLRSRLKFHGEIRAVGDVLIDQVPLMLRCGIDSFAVTNATALKRLGEGRLPGIDNHYQPTAKPAAAAGSYSWRRVS